MNLKDNTGGTHLGFCSKGTIEAPDEKENTGGKRDPQFHLHHYPFASSHLYEQLTLAPDFPTILFSVLVSSFNLFALIS